MFNPYVVFTNGSGSAAPIIGEVWLRWRNRRLHLTLSNEPQVWNGTREALLKNPHRVLQVGCYGFGVFGRNLFVALHS